VSELHAHMYVSLLFHVARAGDIVFTFIALNYPYSWQYDIYYNEKDTGNLRIFEYVNNNVKTFLSSQVAILLRDYESGFGL